MRVAKFISEAATLEAQAMQNFARLLEQIDVEQKSEFSTAVRYAIDYHGIAISEFVDEFRVSVPTVSRWARGTSAPHPMARPRIINWIKRMVDTRARELAYEAELAPQAGTTAVAFSEDIHTIVRVK
jgi:DNA-binding transcriptional regulator YiaG